MRMLIRSPHNSIKLDPSLFAQDNVFFFNQAYSKPVGSQPELCTLFLKHEQRNLRAQSKGTFLLAKIFGSTADQTEMFFNKRTTFGGNWTSTYYRGFE